MGPHYIPPSAMDGTTKYHCSWYAPGASGGVNIDSGAAVDPETGLMYVGAQYGLSTTEVVKDPCSEHRYVQGPRDTCGRPGAMPPPPGYVPPARGAGAGGRGGGGRGGGGAAVSYKDAQPGTSTIAGISIVKPRELGGITAYNMNTGDKAWWIPNGGVMTVPTPQANSPDAALFAGVKLPSQPGGRGMAQVITTKTLVIYGTGRNGGPPADEKGMFRIYAVDKATGKQVGAVPIQTRTSAVPMTFMHNGKQYIVFATGITSNTALVALTLPN
jgi:hypothetical protein